MKIGAIVQARTSSTRLPGKVLKDLPYGSGITVLQQVVRRLKKAAKLDDVIVATTIDKADEKIVKLAEKENVKWFKGSIDDVLERYYLAAKENDLDVVVRVTSDCPCVDAGVVDLAVEEHVKVGADYTSTDLMRTFPYGLDVEALSFDALQKAHFEAKEPFEKEHVSSYIYKSNPQMFKICNVEAPERLRRPDIRVTLDAEEDYALLCTVFDYLYFKNECFNVYDIVNLFEEKPWLKWVNRGVVQKKVCDTLKEEMQEALKILAMQDLKRARAFIGSIYQDAE